MATECFGKFTQIATSSVVIDGRLYTTVIALDQHGEVWLFRPHNRTDVEAGTWVRLGTERKKAAA